MGFLSSEMKYGQKIRCERKSNTKRQTVGLNRTLFFFPSGVDGKSDEYLETRGVLACICYIKVSWRLNAVGGIL